MTTTATFTPGPWTYKPCTIGHPDNLRNRVVKCDGYNIARVFSEDSTLAGMTSIAPPEAVAEANARLIAAAPDLLAACRAALEVIPGLEVRSWPPGHAMKRDAIGLLTAAINAATGEQ